MSTDAYAALLRRLRDLREASGLTQEGFAELAGISYKYYQSVETGKQEDLRFSTLVRLANAYGLEVWELLHPMLPRARRGVREIPGRPHRRPRKAANK